MSNILDLSGADTSGFEALPAGDYNCVVYAIEMTETKGGPDAKLPAGTPMCKVQFAIQDEGAKNRRLFTNYVLGGTDEDKKKKALGSFVRFLTNFGFKEEDLKKKGFNFEKLGDVQGQECVVRIKQKPKYGGSEGELDNEVVAVKPAGSAISSGGTSNGLL